MTLEDLHRIKQWHVNHRADHPMECRAWDATLIVWLMGWVGWVPTLAFDAIWAIPACTAAMFAPSLYVAWRVRAHHAGRLRCDWLPTR